MYDPAGDPLALPSSPGGPRAVRARQREAPLRAAVLVEAPVAPGRAHLLQEQVLRLAGDLGPTRERSACMAGKEVPQTESNSVLTPNSVRNNGCAPEIL